MLKNQVSYTLVHYATNSSAFITVELDKNNKAKIVEVISDPGSVIDLKAVKKMLMTAQTRLTQPMKDK